jgi:hypothetical protein
MSGTKKKSPPAPRPRSAVGKRAVGTTEAAPAILELPPAALATLIGGVVADLQAVQQRIGTLAHLTPELRHTSSGRLRPDEAPVLESILDAVDSQPGYFQSLADKDQGTDPQQLETQPARDQLRRRAILQPLQALLSELVEGVSDTILVAGEQARALTTPAYAIAVANAAHAPKLKTALAKAQTYYQQHVRKSLKTRAANSAARAASEAGPAGKK